MKRKIKETKRKEGKTRWIDERKWRKINKA